MLNLRGRNEYIEILSNYDYLLDRCRQFIDKGEYLSLCVRKPRLWGKTHLLCTLLKENEDSVLLVNNSASIYRVMNDNNLKLDAYRVLSITNAHNFLIGRNMNLLLLDDCEIAKDSLLRQRNYRTIRLFS